MVRDHLQINFLPGQRCFILIFFSFPNDNVKHISKYEGVQVSLDYKTHWLKNNSKIAVDATPVENNLQQMKGGKTKKNVPLNLKNKHAQRGFMTVSQNQRHIYVDKHSFETTKLKGS